MAFEAPRYFGQTTTFKNPLFYMGSAALAQGIFEDSVWVFALMRAVQGFTSSNGSSFGHFDVTEIFGQGLAALSLLSIQKYNFGEATMELGFLAIIVGILYHALNQQ